MNQKIFICLSFLVAITTLHVDAARKKDKHHKKHPSHHTMAQKQFMKLQREVGIPNPPDSVINAVQSTGPQGAKHQAHFNQKRSDLNHLLSKETLDDKDIANIEKKINEFAALNPARWPRPNEYRAVLEARKKNPAPLKMAAHPMHQQKKTPPSDKHRRIQQEFQALEKKYGIETPEATITSVSGVSKADQGTFNRVRSALNMLLSKESLSPSDIAEIKGKIDELESYSPARWPKAQDYRALLDAKQKQPGQPKPMPATAEHKQIQQKFKQLAEKAGIEAPEKMEAMGGGLGEEGSQEEINAIRSSLNTLLAKDVLTKTNIEAIEEKIDELAGLNPTDWPQAGDYTELLNKKLKP